MNKHQARGKVGNDANNIEKSQYNQDNWFIVNFIYEWGRIEEWCRFRNSIELHQDIQKFKVEYYS